MDLSTLKRLGKLPLVAGIVLAAQSVFAGTLTNVSVTPADSTPGATTTYTFSYTVETQLGTFDGAALLYVNFPNDFSVNVPPGCDPSIVITVDGTPVQCTVNDTSGNLVAIGVGDHMGLSGTDVPAAAEVVVVVPGVTNPPAGSYVFEATGNMPFADTGIRTVNLAGPVEIDVADPQTVTIGTPASSSSASSVSSSSSSAASSSGAQVHGSCGIAHTGTFAVDPPPETLCDAGNPVSYSANPTNYSWDCEGINGGNTANCSASLGFLITPPVNAGGTFDCVPALVPYGNSTTCTAAPNSGYDFSGWGAGDCNGVVTLECVVNNVISDPVLAALFAATPHVITTNISPVGAGSSINCTANPVPNGSDSTCTYTAPNPGYTFANWSGACSGATCVLTNVTSAKSVTANFTAPTFSIAVNTSGSGTASCTPNPVSSGSNSTCTASAGTGYSFTGWSGDCSGNSCVLTNVTANKAVTANFALNTYSISGSAAPVAGGTVNCSGSVNHGSSGSCTATANAGYTFTGWTDCPSANENSCSFTNVTANQSVTANFTVGSYTVTPFAEPENAGVVECTSPVNYGSTGTCTATANTGYRVKEWFWPDCTGASCSFSINAETQIAVIAGRAYFELIPTYNVTTSVSPSDSGRVSCTKDIPEGSSATCSAITNTGYKFAGWGGDCAGTGLNCSLADVTSNKTVSATFVEAPEFTISANLEYTDRRTYALEVNPGLPVGSTLSCTASNPVARGTTVTCRVTHRLENDPLIDKFMGWGGDCTRVEGDSCIIENMSSDKHITNYRGHLVEGGARINPVGAGSLWCTSRYIESYGNKVEYARSSCKAVANTGYLFASYGSEGGGGAASIGGGTLVVNFTPVPESPKVSCTDCNTSNTQTYTSTTNTTTKTSDPDGQGNSTQTSVATTTNTQSGGTTTSVTVNTQTPGGTIQTGGAVSTTDPNAQVNVGSGSTTLLTNNPVSNLLSTAVATPSGATINTVAGSGATNTLTSQPGLGATITQSNSGTIISVSGAGGVPLGSTLISPDGSSSTILGNGSSLVHSTIQDPTNTSYGADTITTTSSIGGSAITTTQTTSTFVVRTTVSFPSSQTTSLISGAISGGFTNIGGGGFSPGGGLGGSGLGGGFGSSNLSVQVSAPGTHHPGYKPGLRKTAADDNAQAAIDITGGSLQSVQLYSDVIGLVEFFKPGTEAGSPEMTAFESTDESFSITLSYPAANQ